MDEIFTNGDGIGIASRNRGNRMKRNRQILKPRKFSSLSLGDLILAVSSCTSSNRETVATVADLFASGQVRLQDNGRFLRVRVCYAETGTGIHNSAPLVSSRQRLSVSLTPRFSECVKVRSNPKPL